jgi:hypothetical protein
MILASLLIFAGSCWSATNNGKVTNNGKATNNGKSDQQRQSDQQRRKRDGQVNAIIDCSRHCWSLTNNGKKRIRHEKPFYYLLRLSVMAILCDGLFR